MPEADYHMRAAWDAKRNGDLAEYKRQYALAMAAVRQDHIDMLSYYLEIDFFVSRNGTAIPMAALLHQA
jgi:hypothetical protein